MSYIILQYRINLLTDIKYMFVFIWSSPDKEHLSGNIKSYSRYIIADIYRGMAIKGVRSNLYSFKAKLVHR